MALYEEPEDDLHYRDAHNEEDGDNRQPGVVVGLEPEGADADLQPHQGQGEQGEELAVANDPTASNN